MNEPFLCLSDLPEQDFSCYEYFHAFPPEIQRKIVELDVNSFADLQHVAQKYKQEM